MVVKSQGAFHYAKLTGRWEYLRKMERHFPIKSGQPIEMAVVILNILLPNSLIRAKNRLVKIRSEYSNQICGPPLEVIPNIPVRRNQNKLFHLNSDRNYRNLWHNGKHPLKALFSLVWRTKMSSVFGTGQSTNSIARIMKANQMSKVCASSHEYPHAEKKSRIFVNRISKVRWPSRLSWEKNLSSELKEKPHGKKNNLAEKEIRIKNVLSASKKFCHESFFLPWG